MTPSVPTDPASSRSGTDARPDAQIVGELLYEFEQAAENGWARELTAPEARAVLTLVASFHQPVTSDGTDLGRVLAKLRSATEFALAYPTVAIKRSEAHTLLNEIARLASLAAVVDEQRPHRHGYTCEQAEREIDWQMASKLEAQQCLRLICKAIALPLDALADGWQASLPIILARLEAIVDEADRAFRERDAALSRPVPGEEQT